MDRRELVTAGAMLAVASVAGGSTAPVVDTGSVANGKVKFAPSHAATEDNAPAPNPDPRDGVPRRIGFAVVGLGRLSVEQILPAFAMTQHARLVALVSGTPAKARLIATQYGVRESQVYDYKDIERLRDNREVDAVYIVLPNSMHREFTERAAAAGKHVLCEKPMANNSADCEAMIAACRTANRKLMIAYRMQYERTARVLREEIARERLGTLKTIVGSFDQNQASDGQWRLKKALPGGGSLPDIGLYPLNAARFLSGEEPVEVSARVWSTPGDARFVEVEETVDWTMRFASGLTGTFHCSYGAHGNTTLRVAGTKAVAVLEPAFQYQGQQLTIAAKRDERVNEESRLKVTPKSPFALEIDHFALCVRNDVQPLTPGEEGLADQRIIEAIYRSAATGAPVQLTPAAGPTRGPEPTEF